LLFIHYLFLPLTWGAKTERVSSSGMGAAAKSGAAGRCCCPVAWPAPVHRIQVLRKGFRKSRDSECCDAANACSTASCATLWQRRHGPANPAPVGSVVTSKGRLMSAALPAGRRFVDALPGGIKYSRCLASPCAQCGNEQGSIIWNEQGSIMRHCQLGVALAMSHCARFLGIRIRRLRHSNDSTRDADAAPRN
jgi:hypothetical protein